MKSKICGISDSKTLEYLTTHPTPPEYIGFIVNYPKSKRFVEKNQLKELLRIDKKKKSSSTKMFFFPFFPCCSKLVCFSYLVFGK